MSACLITGCALYEPHHGAFVWGDLHEVGDCYLFYAVVGKGGQPVWTYNVPDRSLKVLTLNDDRPYYCHGGTIAFTKNRATLNEAAERYIAP